MALALASDLVVLSVGNSLVLEHEGMDRVSIDLPEGQKVRRRRRRCLCLGGWLRKAIPTPSRPPPVRPPSQWLIGNVSAALAGTGKPVIAVTYGGGMPDVSSILADAGVGALLHAGYPSVQVGGRRWGGRPRSAS